MTSGTAVALLLTAATVVLTMPTGRVRRMAGEVTAATPRDGIKDSALILDLLATLLSAGASVESAVAVVAGGCSEPIGAALVRVHAARLLGASWDTAWQVAPSNGADPRAGPRRAGGRRRVQDHQGTLAEIRRGLRFATATGAPSAALLHAHAAQLRRRHHREADRKAAALGVRLVLPLGLCSLPAFICLGVVPVVLGLLPAL